MDGTTKARINTLLRELRSWETGEVRSTPEELGMVYALDPFIIKRIMQSEGIPLVTESGVRSIEEGEEGEEGEETPTQPILLDKLDL